MEKDARVERRPLEQHNRVFSGRKWIGLCNVKRRESTKLSRSGFPNGTAILVHRRTAKPAEKTNSIAAEHAVGPNWVNKGLDEQRRVGKRGVKMSQGWEAGIVGVMSSSITARTNQTAPATK